MLRVALIEVLTEDLSRAGHDDAEALALQLAASIHTETLREIVAVSLVA